MAEVLLRSGPMGDAKGKLGLAFAGKSASTFSKALLAPPTFSVRGAACIRAMEAAHQKT
jgi:hypothetical protein